MKLEGEPFMPRLLVCISFLASLTSCATPPPSARAGQGTYVNSIGMEFILIPAGTFTMGARGESEEAYDFERPRHPVKLSKPFHLGRYEVTQEQWVAVMGSNPSSFKNQRHPVENVSLADVHEFIRRLNSREKTRGYRLPTEAEWEYAARAGTDTTYSFGDDVEQLERHAWYDKNSGGKPHPVGQKEPNPWGLYDMHGNINEYVQDFFDEHYYASSPAEDPSGPGSGSVLKRGGSWFSPPKHVRSAFRDGIGPVLSDKRGFRLARTVE